MKSSGGQSSPSSPSSPPLIHQHHFPIFCLLLFLATVASGLHLQGVTVLPDHPQAETLSIFFARILDEVAAMGNFTYSMRVMPPTTKHGGALREGATPEGLVGEVYYDRADFVIADLEVTRHRESLLEFTRPFLRAKLAALVSRNRPKGSGSKGFLEEPLLPPPLNLEKEEKISGGSTEVDESQRQQPQTLRSVLLASKRVLVRDSVVDEYFRTTADKRASRLKPTGVASLKDALALLSNDTEYALVGDSARLSLLAASDCSLEVITPLTAAADGNASTLPWEIGADFGTVDFAVGFHHTNAGYHQFNNALEELEVTGRLAELVEASWSGPCASMEQQDSSSYSVAGFSGADGETEENGTVRLSLTFWWGFILPAVLAAYLL